MVDASGPRRRPGFLGPPPAAACGALILVLALAALIAPFAPPAAAGAILGAVLVGSGVAGAAALVGLRTPGLGWRIAWVGAATVAGLAVLFHHWTGIGSLEWILAAALLLLTSPLVATALRRRGHGFRAWPLLTALAAVGGGGLVVWAAPHAALMVLSLFLALNLAAFGVTLIARDLVQFLGAIFL